MNIADIQSEARALVSATSISYTDADLLRRENNAYEELVGKLIALDKNWAFGDSNYTSLPTGLSNLTAGTQEYQFSSGWLTVNSVQILDNEGIWHKLKRVFLTDIEPITEYCKTDGQPSEYAVREDFVLLFPAPAAANITAANGLKLDCQRTADLFTAAQVATGTKVPGFASPFHILIALKAALPYAMAHKKDRVNYLMAEIARIEQDMLSFYANRERDTKKVMSTAPISFR